MVLWLIMDFVICFTEMNIFWNPTSGNDLRFIALLQWWSFYKQKILLPCMFVIYFKTRAILWNWNLAKTSPFELNQILKGLNKMQLELFSCGKIGNFRVLLDLYTFTLLSKMKSYNLYLKYLIIKANGWYHGGRVIWLQVWECFVSDKINNGKYWIQHRKLNILLSHRTSYCSSGDKKPKLRYVLVKYYFTKLSRCKFYSEPIWIDILWWFECQLLASLADSVAPILQLELTW